MIDDFLSFGVAYVDINKSLIGANKRAKEILARRDGVYVDDGHIFIDDRKSAKTLTAILDNHSNDDHAHPPCSAVKLHRQHNPDPLFLVAFRLSKYCVLLIQEPRTSPQYAEMILSVWLGLTKKEAQLVALLARGLSLDAASSELGIKVGTARAHIRHVFSKCRVRSQSELIAMVCTSLLPLDLEHVWNS